MVLQAPVAMRFLLEVAIGPRLALVEFAHQIGKAAQDLLHLIERQRLAASTLLEAGQAILDALEPGLDPAKARLFAVADEATGKVAPRVSAL